MRRASGEGSIGRRPNGLYYATIQVSGRRQFVYGRTQSEVVGKLRELQQAARSGRMVEPSKVTVGEFLTE